MGTKNLALKILKSGMLVGTAGLMMGNQSCQQDQTSGRELKRSVEMGKIISPKINLPQGGSFDFEYVANQQVYAVLQNSEHFALRYAPPVEAVPNAPITISENKRINVTKNDKMMLKAFAANSGVAEKPQYSNSAECMINLPNARIGGSVNAFEMIGGGGVNIGFNQMGPIEVGGLAGVNFAIQFAQLDLSMRATHPLTNGILGASNVTSKQTKTEVSFNLNVSGFNIGPSAYYQTPLAKVTKTALTKGVNELYADMKKEEWFSRVLMNHDTHLVMLGGTNLNVQVGDTFNVYNELYYWDGEPCNSKYYGGGASTPVATIEIDWVGDEVSRGKVTVQTDENPVLGAKVKLLKLAPEVPFAKK